MNDYVQETLLKLKELLRSNRFPSQTRLPPERVLAEELGVSRATLRKALSILEDEGQIWRHVGRGTFVGPRPRANNDEVARVRVETNPTEIMEGRLVLEPKLAAIAALRATMEELSQMEQILVRSEKAFDTIEYEHLDGVLHQAISKATHNSLLVSLFMVIHQVREGEIWGSLKAASVTADRRKIYCQQHIDLFRSLKDRDSIRAERVMRDHLETVKRHLLDIPE